MPMPSSGSARFKCSRQRRLGCSASGCSNFRYSSSPAPICASHACSSPVSAASLALALIMTTFLPRFPLSLPRLGNGHGDALLHVDGSAERQRATKCIIMGEKRRVRQYAERVQQLGEKRAPGCCCGNIEDLCVAVAVLRERCDLVRTDARGVP